MGSDGDDEGGSENKNKTEIITTPNKIGIKINLFTNHTTDIIR